MLPIGAGTVDGVTGIVTNDGTVLTLMADEMDLGAAGHHGLGHLVLGHAGAVHCGPGHRPRHQTGRVTLGLTDADLSEVTAGTR